MRCEDIQNHLATDSQLSRLPAGIRAHLIECPVCRQAQAIYSEIDHQLREHPAWQPPSGFAERVSLHGLASIRESAARARSPFRRILGSALADYTTPILLGLAATVFSLLVLLNANSVETSYPGLADAISQTLIANAGQVAWITGILSICFSAWITRRALQ